MEHKYYVKWLIGAHCEAVSSSSLISVVALLGCHVLMQGRSHVCAAPDATDGVVVVAQGRIVTMSMTRVLLAFFLVFYVTPSVNHITRNLV